jgi:ADP-ribose pyrophosphatase
VSKSAGGMKVLSSKVMYQGPVFGVRRDRVREPGGIKATRDIVTHPGSVVVLPVFSDGRILLIRQYRHSAKQFMWELVAGRKDPGETFGHGARRELLEETGYRARRLTKMLDVFPTPGFVDEKMMIFLAEGLTEGAANPEEDEKITARKLSLGEAERWVRTGKVRDAKSVAGILYYSKFVARRR